MVIWFCTHNLLNKIKIKFRRYGNRVLRVLIRIPRSFSAMMVILLFKAVQGQFCGKVILRKELLHLLQQRQVPSKRDKRQLRHHPRIRLAVVLNKVKLLLSRHHKCRHNNHQLSKHCPFPVSPQLFHQQQLIIKLQFSPPQLLYNHPKILHQLLPQSPRSLLVQICLLPILNLYRLHPPASLLPLYPKLMNQLLNSSRINPNQVRQS